LEHNFKFDGKTIAPPERLLATNLEFVLNGLLNHCKTLTEDNIKNVLLFFYKAMAKPSFKVHKTFKLAPIDYGKEMTGNFISLYQ
jgi:hypothetical protein